MNTPISFSFTATVALLAGTIFLGDLTARRVPSPLAVPLVQISPDVAGWKAIRDQELPASTLHALDATSYLSRAYKKDSRELDLFIAFYAQQRAGESMHSPKHCLPGAGWEIWKHDSALVSTNGSQYEVNNYSIQNSGTRMLMLYWYQSKSRIIASEYLGKILLAHDTILTGRTAGSIVRIMLPDVPSARDEGVAFAASLIPEVQRCFGNYVR
jgi:EpsI family protein